LRLFTFNGSEGTKQPWPQQVALRCLCWCLANTAESLTLIFNGLLIFSLEK